MDSRSYLQLISVRIDSPPAKRISPISGDVDDLIVRRHEVHLDTVQRTVVERAVLEAREVEVRAELAIEHAQHVDVELRGHALRIVVRALDHGRILAQIGAEQESIARSQRVGHVAEQPSRADRDRSSRSCCRGTR